jgi:Cytochrome P460
MSKLMYGLIIVTLIGSAAMLAASLRAAPALPAPATQPKITGPKFSSDGQLQRPVNYRNWRFVSAGLGMSYGPAAQAAALTGHVMFDNVFVQPEAYDAFLRDNVWPEGTMFVLELRGTQTKRVPNNGGHFQTDLHGIEVSVKDSARFKGRWAYFEFGMEARSATPEPESGCFACHQQHAAVDMTFVQFYPTLQKARY